MFKYLWIVILVSLVGGFVGYTAVCMYKSIMDTIDYYGRHEEKEVNALEFIESAWTDFTSYNDVLCGIWICIIVVTIVLLFITSLLCYLPETPAE